jgi:HTH-type transcriptional repressor of NAD biosynthesis genes
MVKAFVFGKFLPFHQGHEAMIRYALTQCDWLTVLVCCSDREAIPPERRRAWITQAFAGVEPMEVRIYAYREDTLPNTSQSDSQVSKLWSEIFASELPDHTLLVTSEPYGEYVAGFMGIEHRSFDPRRTLVPISATAIRNDLFSAWRFLPDSVKPDYAIKVVILGTESTGKSTLTQQLAAHYACSAVSEAGRDLIADSNTCTWDDLPAVAAAQARRIDSAVRGPSPLVIIDTDVHITMSYATFLFNRPLDVDPAILASHRADLYLYLDKDVEYVQDGTRLEKSDRDLLDPHHRETLMRHRIDYVLIRGDWDERFQRAVQAIDLLLESRRRISSRCIPDA